MADIYPFADIEAKWQKYWYENKQFQVTEESDKPKYYLLEMFPYPSGQIHMGNGRVYSIGDLIGRYLMMQGYNVLHPMGWDAFGLPAENAAIQRNTHPAKWTTENIENMRDQFKRMGISYDWSREVATCSPDYYKWGQWLFLKFYERGLAYRKEAMVNWCSSCQTTLANEEVEGGECWRCGTTVVQKPMPQWFFKITDYADELLEELKNLKGWPDRVKMMQENWIGRSEGAEVDFPIADSEGSERAQSRSFITVYTTRPDTLFGATYMVFAPEHPMIRELIAGTERESEILDFINEVSRIDKAVRMAEETEKHGIFTGAYCINPLTKECIPIWIADYVLMEYGTGAIMAVPAHDERDFEFAQKYGLPIRVVIQPPGEKLDPSEMTSAYVEPGIMDNSGQFNGLDSEVGIEKITEYLESEGIGEFAVNYKLRDWCISRQNYWGNPIPMIYCDDCGVVPVPEPELPVSLPIIPEFTQKGSDVLKSHEAFYYVKCPKCGGRAHRETDTMSTFVDSAWYFARYIDPKNDRAPFSHELADYYLPVDQYVGGPEHAVLHLLYARFFMKVMRDIGLVESGEPFTNLLAQGMVNKESYKCPEHGYLFPGEFVVESNPCGCSEGGKIKCAECGREAVIKIEKMSKSKGNVVSPLTIIDEYGADTMRLFLLFAAPPERDLDWNDQCVEGCFRFLNRVWRIFHEYLPKIKGGKRQPSSVLPTRGEERTKGQKGKGQLLYELDDLNDAARKLSRITHETIKRVTVDIGERRHFNTEISAIMELVNHMYQMKISDDDSSRAVLREAFESMTLLLSPFAPHIAEEMWEKLGNEPSIVENPWPKWNEESLKREEILIVVQVNGKVRARVNVPADATEEEIREAALAEDNVQCHIEGKTVRKVIYVPKKLVNVVIR